MKTDEKGVWLDDFQFRLTAIPSQEDSIPLHPPLNVPLAVPADG
jgi:hypothetical protein